MVPIIQEVLSMGKQVVLVLRAGKMGRSMLVTLQTANSVVKAS